VAAAGSELKHRHILRLIAVVLSVGVVTLTF